MKDPVVIRHPVTRGVNPFELKEAWYGNLTFGNVNPLLQAVPSEEEQTHTLAWTCGENMFSFTGGRFYSSCGNPGYRKQ